MNYKKTAIVAVFVILSALMIYEMSFYNPQETIDDFVDKQYTAKGFLLCDTYKDKCSPQKTGYIFRICKTNNPSEFQCISLYMFSGDKRIEDYEKYVNKTVDVTGIVKSVPLGSKSENCELSQIGCYRGETYVLDPQSIREI